MPARIIRLFTGEPYSHTSISLDVELKEMYSFARRQIYNPFNSGFISEDIEQGIFGKDKNIYCSIYAVPVTPQQYEAVQEQIKTFEKDRDTYNYNYIGLVGILFGKNIVNNKRYFCSQFVSYVFHESGIHLFSKASGLVRPYDFHLRLKESRIYRGKLSEYRSYLKKQQIMNVPYVQNEIIQAI